MGWFDDIVRDVGNAARNVGNAFVSTGDAVLGGARDIVQGGGIGAIGDKLGKRVNQVVGSGLTIASGGILETSSFQNFAERDTIDRLSLGLSGDLAGVGRLSKDARARNDIRQEDLDDLGRAVAKGVGAIAAAGYVAADATGGLLGGTHSSTAAAAEGSSWLPGWLPSLSTTKDAAMIASIGKAAVTGNTQQFLETITGEKLPDFINTIAPPLNPTSPSAPRSPPQVSSPSVSDPWAGGGGYSVGTPGASQAMQADNTTMLIAVGAVALVAAVVIARRR